MVQRAPAREVRRSLELSCPHHTIACPDARTRERVSLSAALGAQGHARLRGGDSGGQMPNQENGPIPSLPPVLTPCGQRAQCLTRSSHSTAFRISSPTRRSFNTLACPDSALRPCVAIRHCAPWFGTLLLISSLPSRQNRKVHARHRRAYRCYTRWTLFRTYIWLNGRSADTAGIRVHAH
jgi:hypothetical protein